MANPSFLLIKPVIKFITKEASKLLIDKTVKGSIISVGLQAIEKGNISSLDAINITRTLVDKNIAPTVAKSLGITTKELKELTKKMTLTDARKRAVKGRNYIKNVNRFIENPQSTIKEYIKNELKRELIKSTKNKKSDEKLNIAKLNALKLLEGKFKTIDRVRNNLRLSRNIWLNIDKIDIDIIFEVLEYLEVDFYYQSNYSEIDNPIYLDINNKGYKKGMEERDFIGMVEDMLLKGYHSKEIDVII